MIAGVLALAMGCVHATNGGQPASGGPAATGGQTATGAPATATEPQATTPATANEPQAATAPQPTPATANASSSNTSGSKAPASASSATATATAEAEWCAAGKRTSQEGKHGVSGAIAELNARFLETYTVARAGACSQLESRGLVIRYAFNTIEARHDGKPLLNGKVNLTPKEYHPVKDISHAVVLAALLFDEPAGAGRDGRVQQARLALDGVAKELADPGSVPRKLIPPALLPGATLIVEQTRAALTAFAAGALDPAARKAYFTRVRPALEANLRGVSAAVVRQLHETVKQIRTEASAIDPKAWDSVLVVIGVMHQARAREIGIQYFQRLLAEPPTEGAIGERRLVISEGITKASEQYGVLGAHVADQAVARLVFDNPVRLQWDVLADDGGELNRLLPKR